MPATLTVEVSDEVLEQLRKQSLRKGKSPEALAAEYLATVLTAQGEDRLLRWAGTFASDVPDAAERHDYYLGQALAEELKGESKK
jgi:hypothetical protein